MDYVPILLSIAIVQLLGAASPGPTFVMVTSHAISGSRRDGLLVVCGVLTASLAWALLAAAGLGLVTARVPAIYTALQFAGAVYLIWMGAKMLIGAVRGGYSVGQNRTAASPSRWRAVRAGFLTNMANPKSIAYYTSIFAVVFPPDPPAWLFAAAVGVAMLTSALWWTSVAVFFSVGPIRRGYERVRRGLDAVTGTVLILFGLRMALSR